MIDTSQRWLRVVIPAHDEREMIEHSLSALLEQDTDVRLEIVVVAAACSDETAGITRDIAARAAERGHGLRTIEIDVADKAAALDAGDAALLEIEAVATPAIGTLYLDADTVLSSGVIRDCVDAIDRGAHLAAPGVRFRYPRGFTSRRFLRVYQILPNVRDSPSGRGCYLVSTPGRRRWQHFPPALPDDAFVRAHFARTETAIAAAETSLVHFPCDDRLVAVVARWRQGNAALRASRPSHPIDRWARCSGLWAVARTPSAWLALPTFLIIRWRASRHTSDSWVRGR